MSRAYAKYGIDCLIGIASACLVAGVLGVMPGTEKEARADWNFMTCPGGNTCLSVPSCKGASGTYGNCGGWGIGCTNGPMCQGTTPPPAVTCYTATGC
jgi:hypothetical protein